MHRKGLRLAQPPCRAIHEKILEVTQALPHRREIHGITLQYTGEPTTTRWYTAGSKRRGRAGWGIYIGNFRAPCRMHGPQHLYRAERVVCALASKLARKGDGVILDNQDGIQATPTKRRWVVKDQDYRDIGYHNTSTKCLTVRWTPGHRKLEQAPPLMTRRTYKGKTTPTH